MDNVITVMEAEKNGVSMETVKVCRDIRRLATIDRIKLDELEMKHGRKDRSENI